MARDLFHDIVRIALEKDGWKITDDPLSIRCGGVDIQIDLGGEKLLLAAEKDTRKIAVDKLETYRSIVKEILTKYSQYKPSYGEIEIEQIFDCERDRYQLLAIGWNKQKRIYGTTIHLDIKNEKIWIQQNTTEFDLASDLMDRGVPKQDIVIGFHTPKMRQLTDFAVG